MFAALNCEPLIKTLQRNASGQYELHSANRHYKPIPVREEDEFEVGGIATDCLRRLGHARPGLCPHRLQQLLLQLLGSIQAISEWRACRVIEQQRSE